jgi:hypothetical protein
MQSDYGFYVSKITDTVVLLLQEAEQSVLKKRGAASTIGSSTIGSSYPGLLYAEPDFLWEEEQNPLPNYRPSAFRGWVVIPWVE